MPGFMLSRENAAIVVRALVRERARLAAELATPRAASDLAIRTLISVPAGIAGMKLQAFLAWTTAGTALWTAFLTGLGYLLEGRYGEVAEWANPVTNVVVVGLLLGYLYRIVTFRPHPGRDPAMPLRFFSMP